MALQILRPKDSRKKLGVGNTKYYELKKKDPTFPKDVILGKRARGIFEHELDAWLESRRAKGAR
jgi:prophage regulatory protein